MGVGDGDGGYGFARRGNPVRRKLGRRTAVPRQTVSSGDPGYGQPPDYVSDHAARSGSPWVWLLIGLLLGTGGTLLTASFWLPDRGRHGVAVIDHDNQPSTEDRLVAESTPAEPIEDAPQPATTEIAGIDLQEPTEASSLDQPLPPADDLGEIIAPSAERAPILDIQESDAGSAPDGVGIAANGTPGDVIEALEPPLPSESAVLANLENPDDSQAADVPAPPSILDPVEALANLVAAAAEPTDDVTAGPVNEPPDAALPAGPSGPAKTAPPEVFVELTPPNPADVLDSDVAAIPTETPPVADIAEREEGFPGGTSEEPDGPAIEPVIAAAPTPLPPRIREALQAAAAESRPVQGSNGRQDRLYRVQLAAVDNQAAARVFWREVNERLPGILTDVDPIFDERTVGRRLFVRVWVGAFNTRRDADGYCGWLQQQGQDCFVTRVDNL